MRVVRDAIVNAFQRADLNQLLTFEFNQDLAYWVAPGSFNNEVFELLKEFRTTRLGAAIPRCGLPRASEQF